jgi:class 3 adenylate cyclase
MAELMNLLTAARPSATKPRRLRAVFAADVVDFAGHVSASETRTLANLLDTRRIARKALDAHGGWLFGMPGDGIFALFESAVEAVRCAVDTQAGMAAIAGPNALQLRIGIHMGEVLFQDDQPFGEALVIAARLESLAQPGGILVSGAVFDAVSQRSGASFDYCGSRRLKHIPRPVVTYSVRRSGEAPGRWRPNRQVVRIGQVTLGSAGSRKPHET